MATRSLSCALVEIGAYRLSGNVQRVGDLVRAQIRLDRGEERVWAMSFDQAADGDPRDLFVPISRQHPA